MLYRFKGRLVLLDNLSLGTIAPCADINNPTGCIAWKEIEYCGERLLHSFPYEDFFYLNDNSTKTTFSLKSYTCRYMNQVTPYQKTCSCDDSCWKNNSCCIEKHWDNYRFALDSNVNATFDDYINELYLMKSRYKQKQCLPLIQATEFLATDHILMTTSCTGVNKTEYDTNMCYENGRGETLLPVIGSDQEIYKNLHCARCNDIFVYRNLPLDIICNSSKFTNNSSLGDCVVRQKSANATLCKVKIQNQCPHSNPFFKACNSYQALISFGARYSIIFANPHCLWCKYGYSNLSARNIFCNVSSDNSIVQQKDFVHSFTIHFTTNGSCRHGNLWNNDISECSRLDCAQGYIEHDQECIKVFFPYKIFFKLGKDDNQNEFTLSSYTCELKISKTRYGCQNKFCYCSCEDECWHKNECCIDKYWSEYVSKQSSLAEVTLDGYLDELYLMQLKFEQKKCLPLIQDPHLQEFSDTKFMVSSCLGKNRTEHQIDMCLEDGKGETLLPVIGKDNVPYKNQYCAQCNDVYEYQIFPVTVICNRSKHKADSKLENCLLRPKERPLDYFYQDIRCRNNAKVCPYSHPYFKACTLYKALAVPIGTNVDAHHSKFSFFANPHCLWCHGKQWLNDPKLHCKICEALQHGTPNFPKYSFVYSFIMNFGGDAACGKGAVWDNPIEKCSTFKCIEGYVAQQSQCVKVSQKISRKQLVENHHNGYNDCLMQKYSLVVLNRKNISHAICSITPYKAILQHTDYVYHLFKNDASLLKQIIHYCRSFQKPHTILTDSTINLPRLITDWNELRVENALKGINDKVYLTSVPIKISSAVKYDITRKFPNFKICFKPIVTPASLFRFDLGCNIIKKTDGNHFDKGHYILLSEFNEAGYTESIVTCDTFYSYSDCQYK